MKSSDVHNYTLWMHQFNRAILRRDVNQVLSLFTEDCFWRDLLAFTWNIYTAEGQYQLREMLDARLEVTGAKNFEITRVLDDKEAALFKFDTIQASGTGVLRMKDGKCWSLFTVLDELTAFPEPIGTNRPQGMEYGVSRTEKSWMELRQEADAALGTNTAPYCLIVGASQNGLALGARLKRLGVPTIIVDSRPRVGDSWRSRYRSLCLHDPVWLDHLPYLKFPDDWPVYTPKDRMGDWLEAYAKIMDLNVWNSTTCSKATYDPVRGIWDVTLMRDGLDVTLNANHLVLATGLSGRPEIPKFPGQDKFTGDHCHSSAYTTGEGYNGKRCVVVGSNTSAHDICADLWKNGADVTLIQRSSTHIVTSANFFKHATKPLYSPEALANGIDSDTADTISASVPYGLMPHFNRPVTQAVAADDSRLLDRLKKVGFLLDNGEDESGLYLKYLRRGSGYYIDVGASELIANGSVFLRSGIGVAELTENGVLLEDGSAIDADLIVYATGYGSMTDWVAELISPETADKVGKVWGYGSDTMRDPGPWEGELRNVWKPTQQEGLWFQAGSLFQARYYSKFLALQLKARMENLDLRVFKPTKVFHLR